MDQTNQHQKLETLMSQFRRIGDKYFYKKVAKLVVSVSLLSIFISQLFFLLPYSFNFYFPTLPVSLFTHTVNKNCLFILCNGLVVFLAKYDGLTSTNYDDDQSKGYGYGEASHPGSKEKELAVPLMEKEDGAVVVEEEGSEEEEEEEEERRRISGEGHENGGLLLEEGEEEANDSEVGEEMVMGEEEGNGIGLLSTEELNRKFDDFIWKMKEELRIEARQQLTVLN